MTMYCIEASGNFESDEAKETVRSKKRSKNYEDALLILNKAMGILVMKEMN